MTGRPTSVSGSARASEKAGHSGAGKVGGELSFSRSVYTEIAAHVLDDIRDVKEATGDLGDLMTGFIGRLLSMGNSHPGIQAEEKEANVAFQIDVVARHGADFYDLALDIQRRVSERVRHMTGKSAVVNVNVRGTSL